MPMPHQNAHATHLSASCLDFRVPRDVATNQSPSSRVPPQNDRRMDTPSVSRARRPGFQSGSFRVSDIRDFSREKTQVPVNYQITSPPNNKGEFASQATLVRAEHSNDPAPVVTTSPVLPCRLRSVTSCVVAESSARPDRSAQFIPHPGVKPILHRRRGLSQSRLTYLKTRSSQLMTRTITNPLLSSTSSAGSRNANTNAAFICNRNRPKYSIVRKPGFMGTIITFLLRDGNRAPHFYMLHEIQSRILLFMGLFLLSLGIIFFALNSVSGGTRCIVEYEDPSKYPQSIITVRVTRSDCSRFENLNSNISPGPKQADTFVYYNLHSFGQNGYLYFGSRNTNQLYGAETTSATQMSSCTPIITMSNLPQSTPAFAQFPKIQFRRQLGAAEDEEVEFDSLEGSILGDWNSYKEEEENPRAMKSQNGKKPKRIELSRLEPKLSRSHNLGPSLGKNERDFRELETWRKQGGAEQEWKFTPRSLQKIDPILSPCGLNAVTIFTDAFKVQLADSPDAEAPSRDVQVNQSCEVLGCHLSPFQNPDPELSSKIVYQWLLSPTYQTIFNIPRGGGMAVENGHFMNWMRPEAFTDFRKLYGKLEESVQLPFWIQIENRFPIKNYGARKFVEIASATYGDFIRDYVFLIFIYLFTGTAVIFVYVVGVLQGPGTTKELRRKIAAI